MRRKCGILNVNYLLNGKVMIITLTVGLVKMIKLSKMGDFLKPFNNKNKIEVKLDLSNYATKSDLKNATGVDTSQFAKKDNLVNFKSEIDESDVDEIKNIPSSLNSFKSKVDKLDVDKLKPVSVNLKKLSDVVYNDVGKKTAYDELIKKIYRYQQFS